MPLAILPFLCAIFATPADTRPWHAFTDSLTEMVGFKDASGKVRVPARYSNLTSAVVFRNVVAVAQEEPATGKLRMHYLRRDGSTFGHDSVPFLPDLYLPCEEEGRILFHGGKSHQAGSSDSTDRLGYFDSTGKVAIPARFVVANRFQGGYAVVMEEGVRKCGDGSPWTKSRGCEHWYWAGERELIDRDGKVMARPFDLDDGRSPDWTRAKVVESEPDTGKIRIPLLDGRILSIPDIERDFSAWFTKALPAWKGPAVGKALFFRSVYSSEDSQWILPSPPNIPETVWSKLGPDQLLASNRKRFTSLLDSFRQHLPDLRYMAQEDPQFGATVGMIDDCGQADRLHHPTVRVTWDPGDNVSRREILFVRTSEGYRIIEVQ